MIIHSRNLHVNSICVLSIIRNRIALSGRQLLFLDYDHYHQLVLCSWHFSHCFNCTRKWRSWKRSSSHRWRYCRNKPRSTWWEVAGGSAAIVDPSKTDVQLQVSEWVHVMHFLVLALFYNAFRSRTIIRGRWKDCFQEGATVVFFQVVTKSIFPG